MTVMMRGRSGGKSTSHSPGAVIALCGALDRPQKTGDQVVHEFINTFKPAEPEPLDYDPHPEPRQVEVEV